MTRVRGLVLGTLLVLFAAVGVRADGGTPLASGLAAGPYEVTVYSDRVPLIVGTTDISVLVQEARDRGLADLSELRLVATSGDKRVEGPLTREKATNKLFYAGFFEFPSGGDWEIAIEMKGTRGDGAARFRATVQQPDPLQAALEFAQRNYAAIAIAAIAIVASGWLARWTRSRRRNDRAR